MASCRHWRAVNSWKTGRPRKSGRPSTDAEEEIVSASRRAMRGIGSFGVDGYCGGVRVLGLLDRLLQTRVLRLHQERVPSHTGAGRFGRGCRNARVQIDTVENGGRVSAATTIVATVAALATCASAATAPSCAKPTARATHR